MDHGIKVERPLSESYTDFALQFERKSFVDISHLGRWRLSSYKGDHGLPSLLENSPDSYWQSDGDLPHFVEIQFAKLVDVSMIGLFLDYSLDESYTPQRARILAGFGRYDLVTVNFYEFAQADGWFCIKLDYQGPGRDQPLKCTMLRIEITRNFQNGKDTHLRGLRVVAARPKAADASSLAVQFQRI